MWFNISISITGISQLLFNKKANGSMISLMEKKLVQSLLDKILLILDFFMEEFQVIIIILIQKKI